TFPSRTHTCGDLCSSHVGQRVILNGWAQKIRKISSELAFLPIRDSFGTTQLVCTSSKLREELSQLSMESVICIEGVVIKRSKETINMQMPTGEIEVEIDKFYCLNLANNLPFFPLDRKLPNEEVRLRHRYIDLRRDFLQNNLRKRSLASWTVRNFLVNEVETPILFKSTSEGAREFLVPTRTKGSFYALTQSPQQYKQLLMAGGIDKYFQIAKCFRDEDLRTDRQPEFTQIDLEMSFVKADEIRSLIERLLIKVWEKVLGIDLKDKIPFPRITFKEAISKFGSDKPDTRYGMEIKDISSFVFDPLDQSGYYAECLVVKNGATLLSNSEIKSLKLLDDASEDSKFKCVRINRVNAEKLKSWFSDSPILKNSPNLLNQDNSLSKELDVEVEDLVIVNKRKQLFTISPFDYNFLWIESFPLFTHDNETGRLASTHHPFTAPIPEDVKLLFKDPEQACVKGQHYDLVLNGIEIGGGSIRIHSAKLQSMIFNEILKLSDEEAKRFDHLIKALEQGCPPHGGIALDVMAFPKAASGSDLTVSCPSEVSEERMKEYGIQLI
ncbi:14820_t:CDS:10, partial [Funneliformis geosporum]